MPLVLLMERGLGHGVAKSQASESAPVQADGPLQYLMANSIGGSGLAALLATTALVRGRPWIVGDWLGLLWAIPLVAWLIFFAALVGRAGQPGGGRRSWPALRFEDDIVSLSTRVLCLLGVVFVGQWVLFGLSGLSLGVILLGGISRAASWYFTARTVGVPPRHSGLSPRFLAPRPLLTLRPRLSTAPGESLSRFLPLPPSPRSSFSNNCPESTPFCRSSPASPPQAKSSPCFPVDRNPDQFCGCSLSSPSSGTC